MSLEDARRRAAAVYNAAADRYDAEANAFWRHFGARTIDRLGLRPGDRVLDVCCGSGASALQAARVVGPGGCVIAIDLSERLLALGRAKAERDGLVQVDFRTGDLMAIDGAEEPFDSVVCVFGIFFVPDMAAAVRGLWQAVRPGGSLAVTTWGPGFFEPVSSVFWKAVHDVRPDLHKAFNPWDRISAPASLLRLLEEAGVPDADVVAETGWHPVPTPEAFWDGVLGSGYRGTVDQLGPDDREFVQRACYDFISSNALTAVETNVVYAVARKIERGRASDAST